MDPTPVPVPVPVKPSDAIPFGLASKILAVLGALFAAVAAVTAVIHGDYSQTTITAAILAVVNFVFLALGRYAQAVAKILSKWYEFPQQPPVVR